MPFRSKKTDDHVDTLTNEEPVLAGRLEWVTTATRDQLADVSAFSKSLAGTARTRVTPLTEIPSRRFRASREQFIVATPEPAGSKSSTPWLLIALVAAVASAIVAIAVQRARRRSEEEFEIDLLMESEALAPEATPTYHHNTYDDTYEDLSTNPS